jgi:hypothetical protein
MLGLGLSLQKGISAFNAGRALVSSYIRRVTEAGGVLQNAACDAAAINELNQDRLLEPASWVLVPDGIKEDVVFAQKPTSGLGDLSFSRASDATYTDSTGVVRRSPYNLVQQSEDFSNAAWSKIGSPTIVANAATAPNGTLTADSVTGAGSIILYQGVFRAQTYTQTCYAKAGTGNVFGMYFGGTHTARFNLTTGTVTSQSGGTASIESVGDGWYRCALTATTTIDQFVGPTFTPNGTVFIWGAQLVEGTEALDYFPTTDRQNVPRIDFRNADGTLSSCGRLLLEPQRTNSIRNSSMVGAVAGTPGTLPTNWTTSNAGLTRTVVGTGTENGLPYVDVRFNGTATSIVSFVEFENRSIITASVGQTWSSNVYVKNIDTTAQANQVLLSMYEWTSGGTYLSEGSINIRSQLTTSLKRFDFVRTLASATTARVTPLIQFILTNGATYDFTIRIAAPQMELGANATTWVPTTTAAVTRIADAASKTGVSSLIGQTEGTMFVDLNLDTRQSFS